MDMKSRSTEHGPEPTTWAFLICGCNGHTIYVLWVDPPAGWQNSLLQGFGHYLVSMRIVHGPSSLSIEMVISSHLENCPNYGQPEIPSTFPPSSQRGPVSPSGKGWYRVEYGQIPME